MFKRMLCLAMAAALGTMPLAALSEEAVSAGDLLFGDTNFSGRLPITFPADIVRLPAFDDYTMQGRTYKYMTPKQSYNL